MCPIATNYLWNIEKCHQNYIKLRAQEHIVKALAIAECNTVTPNTLGLLLEAILFVYASIAQVCRCTCTIDQCCLQPFIVLVSFRSHLFRNGCTSWSNEVSLLYFVRGPLSVQSVAKLQDILEVLCSSTFNCGPPYTKPKEDEQVPHHSLFMPADLQCWRYSPCVYSTTKPSYDGALTAVYSTATVHDLYTCHTVFYARALHGQRDWRYIATCYSALTMSIVITLSALAILIILQLYIMVGHSHYKWVLSGID